MAKGDCFIQHLMPLSVLPPPAPRLLKSVLGRAGDWCAVLRLSPRPRNIELSADCDITAAGSVAAQLLAASSAPRAAQLSSRPASTLGSMDWVIMPGSRHVRDV